MLTVPAHDEPQSLYDQSSLHGHDGSGPPAKRHRQHNTTEDRQRREIGLMRQSDGVNAPSFVGSASGIYFVRSIYNALAKSHAHLPPQTPDQNTVPGEEDQLNEAIPFSSKGLWTTHEVVANSSDGSMHFDFEALQGWLESYFDNWHTAYPFLHAPTILEYIEQHVRPESISGLRKQSSPRFAIVRSIMSISLADRRQSGQRFSHPVPAELVFTSFKEAVASIQENLFTPTSIEALQAVVSVQLFLISMLRLNGASRLGGLIVRMAFQMGLHRCPVRYSNFTPEEAELRRRLFWTIYCIDRHLCQSLGLPLTIRDDDVDVCFFDDEKHPENTHKITEMDDRLRMLNFLAKHASIKGQIIELRNKSIHQRQANRELATLIGARIDKWTNEFQCFLDCVDEQGGFDFNTLHRVILPIHRYESVISLNRPLLATDKQGSEYMAALQSCIRAARSVISILHSYLKSLSRDQNARLDDPPPACAPLLWPSLTWSVWMSAFILLHAAIEGEIPKPLARRLADQSVEILKHISMRGSVWPNVCAVAIDDLFLRLLLDSTVTTPQSPRLNINHGGQIIADQACADDGALRHPSTYHADARTTPHHQTPEYQPHQPVVPENTIPSRPESIHAPSGGTHSAEGQRDVLLNHAANVAGPPLPNLDLQSSIPWLSGPDAAAATSANIFEQFDIPFWMGDDQYSSLMGFDI